jgi:hypothetical protein
MATAEVSTVVALRCKAFDLHRAGHRARAAEYTSRALAAAQALGEPDCLVVAHLQVELAQDALSSAERAELDHERRAALFSAAVDHCLAAVATLQRRKAAGTLRAGRCRPAEEAFDLQTHFHTAKAYRQDGMSLPSDADAARLASQMGYQALLIAGFVTLYIVDCRGRGQLALTPEQLRVAFTFVALVADEMGQQPPSQSELGHLALPREGTFLRSSRTLLNNANFWRQHDEPGFSRVTASMERLERTLGRQRRFIDEGLQAAIRCAENGKIADAAAAAAPGLRLCGLARCGAREEHPSHFKSCAACRIPVYCCKECQSEDWPSHKAACKAARKAAAENAD